jgi:enamine deaminase RidA (YjgF/YER057c/UK114 family)
MQSTLMQLAGGAALMALLAVAPAAGQTETNGIRKEKFHFGKEGEDAAGYAQAVKVGNTLYISGTVAPGTMPEQLSRIYARLDQTLKHYGASFSNVVKETLHTTDIEEVKKHAAIRRQFYGNDWPAATWVEIKRLYEPGALVEIELIAVLKE